MPTSASWDKFIQSTHWVEIKDILEKRLSHIRDALELEKDEMVIRNLQGSADQIRFMMTLPDVIVTEKDSKGEV